MSVVEIHELFEGRAGGADVSDGRHYTRRFLVLTDSVLDGPATVTSALGLQYGDRYVLAESINDTHAYLTHAECEQQEGDGLGWIVTATYGPFDALTAGGGPQSNPILMPIDVQWGFRNVETVAEYDNNGKAIVNTANDPFDPPIMIDDPRPMLTVVRNEATYNVGLVYQYRTAVNADPFGPWGPQMCRVIQISGRSTFHHDIGWYWIVTYEFEFNPPLGYRPLILNQGLRKLSQVTHQPVPIVLNGIPISRPMLLTKAGFLAKPTDAPYYVQPQIYPELPFAAFGFDPLAISGERSGFNTGYGIPGQGYQ